MIAKEDSPPDDYVLSSTILVTAHPSKVEGNPWKSIKENREEPITQVIKITTHCSIEEKFDGPTV
jgi:hypothetical protein